MQVMALKLVFHAYRMILRPKEKDFVDFLKYF